MFLFSFFLFEEEASSLKEIKLYQTIYTYLLDFQPDPLYYRDLDIKFFSD